MPPIELILLGTGTSAGVPMIGCACEVCRSTDPRDQRTRTSAVLSCGSTSVLIDASPELRLQCVANQVNRIDAMVLTHAHADHIMGLDDVRRFNAVIDGPLDVWADHHTHEIVEKCFGYAFRAPDPSSQLFRPHLIRRFIEAGFEIGGQRWIPIPLLHGALPILGFRVGDLAYCTDVSEIPEQSYEKLQGLDILVLDGLKWEKHPTHFSIHEAIAAAQRLGARRTYLTHIAHNILHARDSAKLPDGVFLGYDGLRLTTIANQ